MTDKGLSGLDFVASVDPSAFLPGASPQGLARKEGCGVNGGNVRVGVTWQEAEDALIAAFEYLSALPDRDAGLLSASEGRGMSPWPAILRTDAWDYSENYDDALGPKQPRNLNARPPKMRVGKREMALLDAMLLGPRACALAVAPGQRSFVGRVIVMKRWQSPGGFEWSEVWQREGGRASGVTSDALRMRYERAVSRVAAAMEAPGLAALGV